MAKVFSIHEIELHPGVDERDFERFFLEEVADVPIYPGWKACLAKCDRGRRTGKYAVIIEIESVEARDRYYPSAYEESEEGERFDREQIPEIGQIWEKWKAFATTTPGESTVHADYVVVDRAPEHAAT
jgi:hypothetical protein